MIVLVVERSPSHPIRKSPSASVPSLKIAMTLSSISLMSTSFFPYSTEIHLISLFELISELNFHVELLSFLNQIFLLEKSPKPILKIDFPILL